MFAAVHLHSAQKVLFVFFMCNVINKVKEKPSAGQFGAVQRPECMYAARTGPVHGAET